jgi:hypothetical protein
MPQKEIASRTDTKIALSPRAIATDTTTAGSIIDTALYDLGVLFLIISGTVADGTYTPLIEHGDASNLSDAAAVADTDLYRSGVSSGQEADAAFVAADDNKIKKLSYIGAKRYVRLSLVSATTTTGAVIGAIAIGNPEIQPVGDNA